RFGWTDGVQRFVTGVLIVSCSCSFVRKLAQFEPCSARRTVDPDPCVVAHLMANGLLAGYVLAINDVELVPGPEDHCPLGDFSGMHLVDVRGCVTFGSALRDIEPLGLDDYGFIVTELTDSGLLVVRSPIVGHALHQW